MSLSALSDSEAARQQLTDSLEEITAGKASLQDQVSLKVGGNDLIIPLCKQADFVQHLYKQCAGGDWQPLIQQEFDEHNPIMCNALLAQAKDLATVEWIYFEGGEAFLYYPILLSRCQESGRLRLSSRNGHKWLLGD